MPSLFEKDEWLNAVAALKAKAAEFERLKREVEGTYYIAVNDPKLLNEYESLIFKSDVIRGTIESITGGIDYIFKIFNTVFDDTDTSGLGFIPLVPIAVILSAIAGITYWINDSVKYLNKINEIKRIEREGYSIKEAYQMVEDEKGFFAKLIEPKYLLIGTGLILVLVLSRQNRY
ncbi:MAG: hypothetical protein ABW148_18650 [Sedimenticola sp.]